MRELLLPRFVSFWVLAGFLVFWSVFKTGEKDVNIDVKLIVTALLLTYALCYAALERQFSFARLRRDRPLAVVTGLSVLYLAWITLTNTVLSSAPGYTPIGWPEWHSGYLLYAMCILLFLTASLMREITGLQRGLNVAFVMVCVSAFFCVLEYLGFDPLTSSAWFTALTHTSVSIPLTVFPVLFVGNSGYVSAMWLLMAPLPLLALKERPRFAAAFWLVLAVGVAANHGKVTVLLFAGLMLGLLGYAVWRRGWKLGALALAALALSTTGTLVYPPLQKALYSAGLVQRYRSFDFVAGESLAGRRNLWVGALNAWKARPLTGWGFETLQEHYFDFVPQPLLDTFGRDYLQLKPGEKTIHFGYLLAVIRPDRPSVLLRQARVVIVKPHNMLVEELYSNGLPGLLLLLSVFVSSGAYIWRSGSFAGRVVFSGTLLYSVYLCAWFLTLAVAPMAFMLFGVSLSFAARARELSRAEQRTPEQATLAFSTSPVLPGLLTD